MWDNSEFCSQSKTWHKAVRLKKFHSLTNRILNLFFVPYHAKKHHEHTEALIWKCKLLVSIRHTRGTVLIGWLFILLQLLWKMYATSGIHQGSIVTSLYSPLCWIWFTTRSWVFIIILLMHQPATSATVYARPCSTSTLCLRVDTHWALEMCNMYETYVKVNWINLIGFLFFA